MKKKGLINKNVIAAMSLALSATMAMTPVATLAEETVDPTLNTDNTNTESSDAGFAAEDTVEAETAEADAQADTAESAAEAADQAVGDLIEDVLGGENAASSEDGGSAAAQVVGTFVDAAQDLADDKTLKGVVNDLKDANDKIDDAEEADQAIADALSDGGTGVSIANDVANATEANVEQANIDADNIMASIQVPDATQDQIQEAVDQIDKLYTQTESEVAAAKQTVAELSDRYDAAKIALAEAEQKFNDSIGKAGADVKSAKANLTHAQEKVEILEAALEDAQEELEAENKAAQAIKAAEDMVKAKKNAEWGTQGTFMNNYLMYYYIPQMVDPNAENIKISKDKGFTGQDSTRYIATYTLNGTKETQYFNYDRTDRTYEENNQWAFLGNEKDIIIYEKSAEEIEADKYINSYCNRNKISLGNKNDTSGDENSFRVRYNSGEFDVYAYDDNGVTKFIAIDEIKKGTSGRKVEEKDGIYYVNDKPAHKVEYTTAKTASVKMDVASDDDFQSFLSDAQSYVDKYNSYTAATEAAMEAVETAQTEVDALSDAITELQDNHSTRLAKDVLGVEDVASYFELNNITADEAGMLNEMTVDQVVEYFDELLQKAKDKVDNAELKLQDLQAKLTEAEGELDEIMSHISPDVVMDLLDFVEGEEAADDVVAAVEDSAADSTVNATAGSAAVTATDTTAPATAATTGDTTATPAAPATQTVPAGAAQATPGAAQVGGFAAAVDAATNAENFGGGVLGLARAEEGEETVQSSNDEAPATNIFVNTIKETETKAEGDLVTINEGQIALAGTLGDTGADAVATSWWWVMIMALFGAAGREMYEKHKAKKEAIEATKTEKK